MEVRQAVKEDAAGVLALLKRYHVDSIDPSYKKDGFVTTNITLEKLEELIVKEDGVTIAVKDGNIVSFALAASWEFWSEWPFFSYMIEKLPEYNLDGTTLTKENSYQYGPVCVDVSVRGSGVFEKVFAASLENMSKRYPIMVTFINKINPRSYNAHTNKVDMKVPGTFQFNNNDYYLLACPTKRDTINESENESI